MGQIWVLKTEYFYRLLEYRELHEARKSSAQANRNALIAICIAIAAILASIIIGAQQLTGDVRINTEQIATISRHIEKQSLLINTTISEGFSDILNSMKIQKINSNKIPDKHNRVKEIKDNPNQRNAGDP